MRTINSINTEPGAWPVRPTNKKTKPEFGGEPVVQIVYGNLDRDSDGLFELEMLMRKSVYDKLKSGEYSVSAESERLNKLIVIDRAGQIIKPLGATIY